MSTIMSAFRFGVVTLLVILLVACGGGGGASNAAGLTVNTSSLSFNAQSGGTNPTSQTISITVTAPEAAYVVAGVPNGQTIPSWLNVSWDYVYTSSAQLRVSITSTTLTVGTYSQTLRIAVASIDQSLIAYRDVTVTYTVTNNLSAFPSTMIFSQFTGGTTAAQALTLSDHGSGSYAWNASVTYQDGNGWLTTNPGSGNSLPSQISVSADPNLPAGTYHATIIATSNSDTVNIPVTYTVRTPTILASSPSVSFTAGNRQLSLPSAASIQLTSENNSDISYTTNTTYGTGASNWITATGTDAPGNLTVEVNTTDLDHGIYTATIQLTPTNDAPAININVTYTVHATTINRSPTTTTFNAYSGQSGLPTATNITVSTESNSNVSYATSVTYDASASGWLSTGNGTAPDILSLQPNTTSLSPGNYTATVTLTPDSGAAPVNISVAYSLTASSLTIDQSSITFSIDPLSTDTTQYITNLVNTASTGSTLTWTASSSVPWLTVTANGLSGDVATISLIPEQMDSLDNGTISANVTFTYDGPYVTNAILSLPITLNLALPKVNFVAPYVALPNISMEVILRGTGFNNAIGRQISFGSHLTSDFTVVSDTEIRVAHPALDEASYPVKISNNLGLNRSRASLLVKATPVFPYAVIPTSLVRDRTLYDPEREAIYTNNMTRYYGPTGVPRIERHRLVSGSWVTDSLLLNGAPRDLAITPDGHEMIALSSTSLYHINLDNWSITSQFDISILGYPYSIFNFSRIAMTNDGNAIIHVGSQWITMYRYNVLNKSLWLIPGFSYNLYGGIAPVSSMDGSRILVGQNGSSGPLPLYYYDASIANFVQALPNLITGRMSYDRTGTYSLIDGIVYNKQFQTIGVESNLILGTISPDGTHAYGYSPSGNIIRIYDLLNPTPQGGFTEIGTGITISSSPGDFPNVAISNDGSAIFISGESNMIIQPLP